MSAVSVNIKNVSAGQKTYLNIKHPVLSTSFINNTCADEKKEFSVYVVPVVPNKKQLFMYWSHT
jgi:hypothetical protein